MISRTTKPTRASSALPRLLAPLAAIFLAACNEESVVEPTPDPPPPSLCPTLAGPGESPEVIVVDVEMREIPGLTAFGFDLDYDESALELVEVRRSEFTRACPRPGEEGCFDAFRFFADSPAPGMVRVGGFSVSGEERPAEIDVLCHVVFRALVRSGSAELRVTNPVDDLEPIELSECSTTIAIEIGQR